MTYIEHDCLEFTKEWRSASDYIEVHTSGSTGSPKMMQLSKQLIRESALRSIAHFGISNSDVLLMSLSPQYIAAKMMIVRAELASARLIALEPSACPAIPDGLSEVKLMAIVPAQINGLAQALLSKPLLKIRHLLIGGSPLNATQRSEALALAENVWESYGMTETASHIALRRVLPGEDEAQSAFRTLPGINVSSDDKDCLCIHASGINNLQTNDLCQLVSPTEFYITGRYDNVIISGGVKVQTEKVEAAIAPILDKLGDFAVSSRPHDKWGEEVIIAIMPHNPGNFDTENVLTALKSYIASHQALKREEIPHGIVVVDRLARGKSGKLQRRELKQLIRKADA